MDTTYDSAELDKAFGALANQKRRDMVHDLSLHPATVGQLARRFGLSLPAIHKHIRILEEAKLIARKKVGRTNFVALDSSGLRLVQQWVMQYRTEWNSLDATLENYISGMED